LPKFSDPRVREAIGYAFDFEWLNANLFYNFYKRTDSYWVNSELAAKGLPTPEELKLLEPYKGQIPDEVFTTAFTQPKTDGSGDVRQNLRKAAMLLKEAGWEVRNGKLTNVKTGEVMTIEVVDAQADMDRVIAPLIRNLRVLGITMNFRVVDTAQMQKILQTFDFEMTMISLPQSISPGNEQREFWGSAAADQQGSRNIMGIKSTAIDALIDKIIFADSRADVLTATHALDRILLFNYYSILTYYSDGTPVAYWDKFDRPQVQPKFGVDLYTWWVDPAKVARLTAAGMRVR
jgi:microcin C transport system substrate-binding protein